LGHGHVLPELRRPTRRNRQQLVSSGYRIGHGANASAHKHVGKNRPFGKAHLDLTSDLTLWQVGNSKRRLGQCRDGLIERHTRMDNRVLEAVDVFTTMLEAETDETLFYINNMLQLSDGQRETIHAIPFAGLMAGLLTPVEFDTLSTIGDNYDDATQAERLVFFELAQVVLGHHH
jgi:hypothetical protein